MTLVSQGVLGAPWGKEALLFYIGIQLINDVVTVSGGQQSDSAIHTPVSILPQTPLPSELPHGIEQS